MLARTVLPSQYYQPRANGHRLTCSDKQRAPEFHRREPREAAALPGEAPVHRLLSCSGSGARRIVLFELLSIPDSVIVWSERIPYGRRDVVRLPRGSAIAGQAFRCRSRRYFLAEKPRLPAAFGASPFGHRLPSLVPLLLEPAVDEGAHQGARRDAAPQAVAAQAQIGLLLEPHGHRLVAQGSHRRP